MLPSIVKTKRGSNASKEVRFRNFDMIDKVQENFALDNRDSYSIKKIFKKDQWKDTSDENRKYRADRLKEL